jgi:hypothetical protein
VDHVEYVYTVGMDDAEVERRLRAAEAGVLALADDGAAYAVPISHVYEDGVVYLRMSDDDDDPRKLRFADATVEASFLVYGIEGPGDSWSVLCAGPLREVTDPAEAGFDAATMTERFGALRVFDEAVQDVELRLYALDVERLTGRRTAE